MDSLEKRVQEQAGRPNGQPWPAVLIWYDGHAHKDYLTWIVKCVVGHKGSRKSWKHFNGCTLSEALRNALPEKDRTT